jgi:hypothetical protein
MAMAPQKWAFVRQEWLDNLHKVIEGDDPMDGEHFADEYEAICATLTDDKGEIVASVAA